MGWDLPAPEIAFLPTPRDYQALRDEHARTTQEPTPQTEQIKTPEQAKKADGQQEPEPRNYQVLRDEHARATQELIPQQEQEPTRPSQIRAPSPGWTDQARMDKQQEAALRYDNWLNANAVERQNAQPNISANAVEHDTMAEKLKGKDPLADDLKEAKEVAATVTGERNTGHAPEANRLQHENAAVAPEKESGKDLLAADLKEAKESSHALEHGHDTGRGR